MTKVILALCREVDESQTPRPANLATGEMVVCPACSQPTAVQRLPVNWTGRRQIHRVPTHTSQRRKAKNQVYPLTVIVQVIYIYITIKLWSGGWVKSHTCKLSPINSESSYFGKIITLPPCFAISSQISLFWWKSLYFEGSSLFFYYFPLYNNRKLS